MRALSRGIGTSAVGLVAFVLCTSAVSHADEPPPKKKESAINTPAPATNERIEQSLERPVSVDFREAPLMDVIEFFKEFTRENVMLDTKGLDIAQVEKNTPITLHLNNVTVRTALKTLLEPLQLTYLTRDGVLLITDISETSQQLVTRVYPVTDLLVYATDKGIVFGSTHGFIQLIQNTVSTDTWADNGGTGSIDHLDKSFCIVITQTEHVHFQLENLFADLRAAKKAMLTESSPTLPNVETLRGLLVVEEERQRIATEKSQREERERVAAVRESEALKLIEEQERRAKLRLIEAQAKLAELDIEKRSSPPTKSDR